jgi:hypothetical protein
MKFVVKKKPDRREKVLRYILEGIEEGRFQLFEGGWYGVHIKNYLGPAVGLVPNQAKKAVEALQKLGILEVCRKVHGYYSWEIGVKVRSPDEFKTAEARALYMRARRQKEPAVSV